MPSEPVENLLRRALKNHDAIAASLRAGVTNQRLFNAIDDMRAVKAEAVVLGCYPALHDTRLSGGGDNAAQ